MSSIDKMEGHTQITTLNHRHLLCEFTIDDGQIQLTFDDRMFANRLVDELVRGNLLGLTLGLTTTLLEE